MRGKAGMTAPTTGIRFGSPGAEAVHLCVDMQRLFGPGSPWAVPWMEKVLPAVAELAAAHAARTIFTRFIPPAAEEQTASATRITR